MIFLMVIDFSFSDFTSNDSQYCKCFVYWLKNHNHQVYVLSSRYQKTRKQIDYGFRHLHFIHYNQRKNFTNHIQKNTIEKENHEITQKICYKILPEITLFWDISIIFPTSNYFAESKLIPFTFYLSNLWYKKLYELLSIKVKESNEKHNYDALFPTLENTLLEKRKLQRKI